MHRLWLGLFIVFGLAVSGCSAGTLSVKEAWARPAIAGGNSAIYFMIDNTTRQNDTLLSADCQVASHVELHMSSMSSDGTMSMHQQHSVPVPAGEKVEFKPGGLHVMLIDLPAELKVGDTFPLTLTFETYGKVQFDVVVREP